MKKTSTLQLAAALVWLLILVGTVESTAQQTQRQTPASAALYIKGYWEYLPPGYSPTGAKVPCIIFLHGSGERGMGTSSDLNKILNNGPPKHIKNGHNMCFTVNGKTECFMVLSPQTNKWSWKADVMPFVRWALTNYNIDPDRLYCSGLSMGGEGTWFSACFLDNEPNVWAALGVMCGRASRTDGGVVQSRKISVWAFHGEADTAIPLSAGLNPILGMRTAGGSPLWTTYPGVGHGGCWDRGYRIDHSYHNPNLYEWFLSIKRNNPGPRPPVVNAGTDITITLPTNTATLTGTATDPDGTIASTLWTQVSGPNIATIASPAALSTGISGLVAGTYTFSLTATDNTALSTIDQIVVKVNPAPPKLPPVANAGADRSITSPTSTISLTGSGTDPDGTIAGYLWKQDSGPNTATLAGTTTTTLNASNLIVGTYTFSLTVTDNDALTGTDQVVVVVNAPPPNAAPEANAGSDKSITLPTNSTNLVGTGTDSDGTIATYAWTQFSGPGAATITPTDMAATNVSNLVEGVYVFTLMVTDNQGSTDNDQVIVTVLPVPPNTNPTASAGTDITITIPTNSTTLNGSGNDPDGTIATYAWTQTSGPNAAVIANNTAAVTGISGLIEGNYLFTLTVTDNRGGRGADQVLVQVLPPPPNDPPVANAGTDVSITLPVTTANLSGSGTDTDGTVATYQWSQQGTLPAVATFGTPTAQNTSVSGLTVAGVYTFELTVGDDDGDTGSDLVTVTVFPAANIPPTANAGSNVSITLPVNSTPLTGSGVDSDGTIATYLWAQVSGPNTATFSNTSVQNPTVSALAAGIYTFSLTVTDNDGATATDQVQVTVAPEPPNQLPSANAGTDVTLTLPTDQTILTGSGTDPDGSIVSYHWNLISGPATVTLSDVDQQILNVSDLVAGTYSFELVVSDNRGATATDEVKIFVNAMNVPPAVTAGPDRTITLPIRSTKLNGNGSDSDGTVTARLWEQVSGPTVPAPNIVSPNTDTTTINNLIQGIYVFSFKVTDDDGITSSDQVTVTVNPEPPNNPPVADAGVDREMTLPINSVAITGTGTDSDGTVAGYLWSQVSGPNTANSTNVNVASITFSNLVAGTYVFRLTVTDNKGAKGQNDVSVKVNPAPANVPPTVNSGVDQTITLPVNMVSLSGTANDTDGSISTYEWTQILGTSVVFSSPNTAATNVADLAEGVYVFRLTVTDDDGAKAFDEIKVTVKPIPANLPPIADAGGNKILTLPTNSTSLVGSGTDTDGSIADYEWTLISAPASSPDPMPANINTSTINITNLVEGIYLLRLTVTDDQGSTGFDEINIRVQPTPANQPPTADAGDNKLITLPTTSVVFNGAGTDPDGTIASHTWTQEDGPTSATLAGAATANLTASNLVEGTYIFRLTVTDNNGAQGFDEVNVRVNPEPPNQPPVPNAGADVVITLPTNSTPLDATGSADLEDGTVAGFSWSQQAGPNTATITGQTTATPTVSALIQGVYTFRVTTTDSNGENSFDDVQVTVNPEPPNNPPVTFAGDDQIVAAPPLSGSLSGTATDSDGTIASVQWTQDSGPNTATFGTANALTTTITGLAQGTYIFTLTSTDNKGDTDTDQVTVTINANQDPVAFAGGDINVVLPATSVTLTGSGSDADGTIANYSWTFISGPNTPTTSATATPGELAVSGLAAGTYVFEITVTDDKGAVSTDQASIEVTSAPTNEIPVARAGEDVALTLPENGLILNGLASNDPDGVVTAFAWEQISGETATLSDTTFAELEVTDLAAGTYVFELTVTDDDGATNKDQVSVFVSETEQSLIIPKVFTPNGDEKGQTWEWPELVLSQYQGCELSIFSRFGKKVFEMVSYDNSWDGTSNGVKLEEDAYYYVIKCSDGQQTTGGVRIVR